MKLSHRQECLINFEADEREFFSTGQFNLAKKALFYSPLRIKFLDLIKRKSLRIPAEFTEGLTFKVNRQKIFTSNALIFSEGGIGIICNQDKKDVFAI